jgi:hypothetical protein
MVDTVLQERLLTPAEEERIAEIKDALGPALADVSALNDRLIKISILRELKGGDVPDRVTVVGPMPIELRKHERVVFIFNHVMSYQGVAPPAPGGITFPATEQDLYCGLQAGNEDPLPAAELVKEALGDLVLTNRNIYFIHPEGQQRIPMAKITALQPHAGGIQVICEQPQDRSRAFALADPWMAANLIVSLVIRAQNNSRATASQGDARVGELD